MKLLSLILILTPMYSFGQIIPIENNPIFSKGAINNKREGKINGHPTSYYLDKPKISFHAKAFYLGKFCVYDNIEFTNLMDSVLSNDNDARPFYFYIFNRVIELSDGIVSDMASTYCKLYIEKYPCEFLNFCNKKEFDIQFDIWTMFVGYTFDSVTECNIWLQKIDNKIRIECPHLQKQWNKFKPDIRTSVNDE